MNVDFALNYLRQWAERSASSVIPDAFKILTDELGKLRAGFAETIRLNNQLQAILDSRNREIAKLKEELELAKRRGQVSADFRANAASRQYATSYTKRVVDALQAWQNERGLGGTSQMNDAKTLLKDYHSTQHEVYAQRDEARAANQSAPVRRPLAPFMHNIRHLIGVELLAIAKLKSYKFSKDFLYGENGKYFIREVPTFKLAAVLKACQARREALEQEAQKATNSTERCGGRRVRGRTMERVGLLGYDERVAWRQNRLYRSRCAWSCKARWSRSSMAVRARPNVSPTVSRD